MAVPSGLRTTLLAGFTAGTFDIAAACVIYRVGPVIVLQAIAAGLLGSRSFSNGMRSAALGLILQWAMSCLIAGIYVVAARRLLILKRLWVASALIYGVIVFVVMNYVVVPLSAVGRSPAFTTTTFVGSLLAMFLFGLIITYIDHRNSPHL
jgi:uncharacterized membrane protein YagU involved in acid resistance